MNRLRLAQQGYENLAAMLAIALNEESSDRAEAWLRENVCPVVTELMASRNFRLAARWSVDHLEPGVATDERKLVELVDAQLICCAERLLAAIALIDAAGGETNSARITSQDRSAVQFITQRPWFDLVSPEEYFHAYRDLHLLNSNAEHTAAFRKRYELRLPLGDYVLRGLFARIEYWKDFLDRASSQVICAMPGNAAEVNQALEHLFNAKIELDQMIQQLTRPCRSDKDARSREAAVTLVQVYVAYAVDPVLPWLGCPTGSEMAERDMLRSCIRRRGEMLFSRRTDQGLLQITGRQDASLCDPRVLRHIAGALQDVVSFYEIPEDPDDLIEWATDRVRLVLVDRSPRAVYWEGQAVAEGSWDSRHAEWNFLWMLALHSGKPVDQGMLVTPEKHDIRSRRQRLAKLLMQTLELDNLVETVRGQGYQLELDSDELILLRDNGFGQLEFVGRSNSIV